MRDGKIETGKLEGLLSEDARRFLDRAREHFEVEDIVFPADMSYSLAHVLNSLSALTANQDAVFELIRRGEELPGFMPVEPSRLVGWGTSLGHLASEKDAVISLFERLGEIGYSDSQFKVKSERDGKEYNAYLNRFNPTLHAASGIIKLAREGDLTVETLRRVQEEFGQTLPLYFSFQSFPNPTDGVFFKPDGVLELGRNMDVIVEAVKRVGIIDTENTLGHRGSSIHDLYRNPAELASLGARVGEVEHHAKLVTGEPNVDTTYRHLSWFAPLVIEQLDNPQLMGLLENLQPYRARNAQDGGVTLWIQAPINWPDHHMPRVQSAKKLATNYGDEVVAFAKAVHDYGARFNLTDLAADYDAAVTLVGKADELGMFVDAVGQYGSPEESTRRDDEMWQMPREKKLGDYTELVSEGLAHQTAFIGLVRGLAENHGLRFRSRGLKDTLEQAKRVYDATSHGSLDVSAVAGQLHVDNGTYRVGSLGHTVEKTQRRVA